MTTYTERSQEVARNASIAVLVLLSHDNTDLEFWNLRRSQAEWTSSHAFTTRGLRSVGVVGLSLQGKPLVAFKEDLSPSVVDGISNAFLVYLNALLADSFAEQREDIETQELRRLFALCDPYVN